MPLNEEPNQTKPNQTGNISDYKELIFSGEKQVSDKNVVFLKNPNNK